jgi:hypothetical protein
LNSDWYLEQGYSHKICEDYTIVGDGFAIVSDGCSSSEHTDIGARLLALSARDMLLRLFKDGQVCDTPNENCKWFESLSVFGALSLAQMLDLKEECLDATLLVAFVHGGSVHIYMYGDGYVCITFRDGRREYWSVDYPCNAPYYPSYQLDPNRDKYYRDQVKHYRVSHIRDGIVDSVKIDIDKSMYLVRSASRVSNVVMMTDGAGSFLDKSNTGKPVDDISILDALTDFKTMKGEFVRRRARAAIKKWKKDRIEHYDDLAIAGINLDGD